MGKKILIGTGATGLALLLIFIWALLTKVDLLLNLVQAKPVAPTTVSIGNCEGTGYCLKFKHESELVLPPLPAAIAAGCEPYKLPDLATLPKPTEIQFPEGSTPEQQSALLLKYIEKVLDTDSAAKAALLKHYQDYLDSCAKQVAPIVIPLTSDKTN